MNPDTRPSLLLADDDAFVRSALSAQLEGSFHVVAVARDANEAIALSEAHRPDVALVDVEMPSGGARWAVPEIASRSPETCIVILSSDESQGLVVELLRAGAVAYIRKGVTGAEIAQTLADALKFRDVAPVLAPTT